MNNRNDFFGDRKEIFYSKSPARLDVMGGIADYSGSLVLQMPLALYTEVYIAKRSDSMIRIRSGQAKFLYDITDLPKVGGSFVRQKVWETQTIPKWSLYILGCIFILLDDKELVIQGLDIWITSDIPIGAGISSSAALEVAVLQSLYQLYELPIEREKLAILGQRAENLVVGAACGIMDQLAVHLGRKGSLLPIICQPYNLRNPILLPKQLKLFAFNTNIKHSVSGNAYTNVRTAAFMGLSIILQSIGVRQEAIQNFQNNNNNSLPYDAYLANIPILKFEQNYAHLLPQTITGLAFKQQFGTVTDSLSIIKDNEIYQVYNCTRHPIYENERVHRFSQILEQKPLDVYTLGQLMLASHQGYVDCGLSCEEADFIIQKVRQIDGLYGARITGGGSGGTVCVLGTEEKAIIDLQQLFEGYYQHTASIFYKSADGAFFIS